MAIDQVGVQFRQFVTLPGMSEDEVFGTQLCMVDGTTAAGRLVMTVTAIADIGVDLESLLVSFGCCTTQPTS